MMLFAYFIYYCNIGINMCVYYWNRIPIHQFIHWLYLIQWRRIGNRFLETMALTLILAITSFGVIVFATSLFGLSILGLGRISAMINNVKDYIEYNVRYDYPYLFSDPISLQIAWELDDITRIKRTLQSYDVTLFSRTMCPIIHLVEPLHRMDDNLSRIKELVDVYNLYNIWFRCIMILLGILCFCVFILFQKWILLKCKTVIWKRTFPTATVITKFSNRFEAKLAPTDHISLYYIIVKDKKRRFANWFMIYPIQKYTLKQAYEWQYMSNIKLINYQDIFNETLLSHDRRDQFIITNIVSAKAKQWKSLGPNIMPYLYATDSKTKIKE